MEHCLYVLKFLILVLFLFSCTIESEKVHKAVTNDNFSKFQELLVNNKNLINCEDGYGTPLIIQCVKNNREKMANYLLDRGVNVNQTDSEGRTALFFVESQHILLSLLSKGADFNTKDYYGLTPIHILDSIEILNTLIKYSGEKLNIDSPDKNNMTPLMNAIVKGNIDKVKILLNFGADIFKKDAKGLSCIDYADKAGNPTVNKIIQEIHNKNKLENSTRIVKIFGASFNLSASSLSSQNSIAINDLTIPNNCDELVIIGHGGESMPSDLEKIFRKLGKTGAILYGEDAAKAYDEITNFKVVSTGDVQVDFFITYRSNAERLRKNSATRISEKFCEWNNTSGFNDPFLRGDRLPSTQDFSIVVKNKRDLREAKFRIEIYGVIYPKQKENVEPKVQEDPIIDEDDKFNQANTIPLPNGSIDITITDPKTDIPRKINLQENIFYSYPDLKPVKLNGMWFIQGAACRNIETAEVVALEFISQTEYKFVYIFKKNSGEFPYKILMEVCSDRVLGEQRRSLIREKYHNIRDLGNAQLVSRNQIFN